MRWMWIALLAAVIGCGGNNGDGENSSNGMTNSNTVPAGECQTDDDCPAADSMIAFADPTRAACTMSLVRGNYCSECINDSQCGAGFACRDATFCEELPACTVGSDCADAGSEVHKACIASFCDFCLDDADCEDDEICYSRLCATRTAVDPTCIDVSCEGTCDIQSNDDGVATGISCVE